jgi:hypothetical protein
MLLQSFADNGYVRFVRNPMMVYNIRYRQSGYRQVNSNIKYTDWNMETRPRRVSRGISTRRQGALLFCRHSLESLLENRNDPWDCHQRAHVHTKRQRNSSPNDRRGFTRGGNLFEVPGSTLRFLLQTLQIWTLPTISRQSQS